MSHLKYSNYEGYGERNSSSISQAVRIGDKIEISGQGGWDRTTDEISTDLGKQTDQAFANVEIALQQAGGKGWEQVYKVRCYSAPMSDKAVEHLLRNIEKYCPNHRPVLRGHHQTHTEKRTQEYKSGSQAFATYQPFALAVI